MKHEEDLMRERIQKLIHLKGLTQREFAEKIGRLPANLSQILTGERHVPRTLGQSIIKAFPNVNREWLMFGDGTMFVDGEKVQLSLPENTKPRLPRTLTDGHLHEYFEGEKRNLCQEKPIISQFPDYDFSLFLKTDRMSPNYRRGDELFFKKTAIKEWGACYLLDTAEGPKFKKVYDDVDEDNKPVYRCVAYNREEYPDFVIPKNLVFGFYKCVGVLRIL